MSEFSSLDFSEFHPLDHSLMECVGYPGGRRRHLKYAWNYQWRERVRRHLHCRVGLHEDRWEHRHGRHPELRVRCGSCGRPCTDSKKIAEVMVGYNDPKWPWNRSDSASN